jgi:branched-subunit amino acid permease
MKLFLNVYGGDPSDPLFQFFGLILIVTMIILTIRLRKKEKNKTNEDQESFLEGFSELYLEKDILGNERTFINPREHNYKPADKTKLKYIVYISLIVVGLLMIIMNTLTKKGPFRAGVSRGVIHHPDVKIPFYDFYWGDYEFPREYEDLDSNLNFKERNVFEKVE